MEAKAVAKYVRMSPIKLKPVADLVRGKDINEALTILKFTPGKGAEIVEKVVQSALANADVKEMDTDNLYVAEVYANQVVSKVSFICIPFGIPVFDDAHS